MISSFCIGGSADFREGEARRRMISDAANVGTMIQRTSCGMQYRFAGTAGAGQAKKQKGCRLVKEKGRTASKQEQEGMAGDGCAECRETGGDAAPETGRNRETEQKGQKR